jgi:hypothetical protein
VNTSIGSIVEDIPRARIAGVLSRLQNGQSFRVAVLSEVLDRTDRQKLLKLAEEVGDFASPTFIANAIETLYDRDLARPPEPEVVWTGPRVSGCDYTPTLVAARRIVDGAKRRIVVAGYQVTAITLERLGIWSALERRVAVEAIVNNRDVVESDYQIMVAKGMRVHRAASTSNDFAKFHVKAIVSDGESALVGSANFTSFGQNSNIEMGLFVVGPVAATIESMLDRYIETARSTGWVITA